VGKGDSPASTAFATGACGYDCHRELDHLGLKSHVYAAPRSHYASDQSRAFTQFKITDRGGLVPQNFSSLSGSIWTLTRNGASTEGSFLKL